MGTLSATIAGNAVSIVEKSFLEDDSISSVSTLAFKVRDDAGTSHFTKGQAVAITDSVSGLTYTGFVTQAIEDRASPNTLIFTDIGARDNHYLAEKRTYDGPEFTNTPAGAILVALLNVLSAEGITAKYASDRDTTTADFNAGTLSGVVGASNVTDGDLELPLAGSQVSISEITTTDFQAGTLSGVVASSNTLAPTATQAIKLVATCSQPGSSNAYTYVKIWTGSRALSGASIVFSYDMFVLPSSPTGQMGVDAIFTDGTNWRDTAQIPDVQYVFPHPNNDVGPMGVGQWYHRSFTWNQYNGKTIQSIMVVSEGDTVGTYTGYFKNITLTETGPINVYFTLNTTQQMQKNGYSSAVVSLVNTYDLTHSLNLSIVGNATVFRTSPAYSIDAAKILQNSTVTWAAVEPAGTKFILKVSYDGGNIFQTCTKNAPLPNLPPGANIAGKSLIFSEQFWYDDTITNIQQKAGPEVAPVLNALQVTVNPSYNATKTDVVYEIAQNADWAAGTFTNTTNNAGTDLALAGFVRNWDDGDQSSQTIWTTSAQSSADRQNFHINVPAKGASNAEARSRMDFAGTIADGTLEADILVDTATVIMSAVYRTTFWGNADGTWAYAAEVTTTTIQLYKGANGSTPSFTQIGTASLNVSSGNWHHLKIVFVGNNHKVYLDDVLYLNVTDGTYTAAGNVALRVSNPTASAYTAKFDNFGILSSGATLNGTWVSANQSLTAAGTYGSSVISWRDMSTDPGNTDTLLVESQVDGSTYQTCTNGQPIPNLLAGQSLSGVNLKLRLTLTTTTASTMPSIDNIYVYINSQLNSSGNRISPALALTNVGQLGGSLVAWNALLLTGCTLGVDARVDSGSWVDITGQNGGALPGLTPQRSVANDSFTANTAGSYTNTFITGGSVATWTYDTPNSRISSSGGVGGLFIRNDVSAQDVDMFIDMDRSDFGGCVWRYQDTSNYYELVVRDASGPTNPNTVQVNKVSGGSRSAIGTSNVAIYFIRNSYHRIRVTMIGTQITVYFDGKQLEQFTDATIAASGFCGFRSDTGSGQSAARFYQLNILPLGQDVTSHTVQTRLRLASTNPLATPQVTDLSVALFGNTIQAGDIIPQTSFFHKYIDKCIDVLAQQSNYWWYIDKNKVLYFLPRNAMPAPWIGSSTPSWLDNGQLQADFLDADIKVEDSSDLYRNRQIIENVLASTTINETRLGDGVSQSWTFGYQWAGQPTILITAGGRQTTATVGVKNVDTGKQFYYAIGDNTITEDQSGPVYDATFRISFSGPGQYLTYSQADDTAGQAARASLEGGGTGIVTMVEDGTGLTKTQGDTLAQDRLNQYSRIGRLLKATTRRGGLAPGQLMNVFLPEHGINDTQFLIRQIQTKITSEFGIQQPWQTIEAVSGADIGDWTKLYQRSDTNTYINRQRQVGGNALAYSYNVKDYGAIGDGVADDTTTMQAAINAAGITGGYVDIPPGTYKTSATLSMASDNVILRGAGWGSVIKPASGAQFDVISTPIPASAGLSGYVRNYIGIERLKIDCSSMTGTTAGQGNGIHWYGVRYSFIRDVFVVSCKNWAILLDGDNTGASNFGYNNQVLRCVFDLGNASVRTTNCEANEIVETIFKWAGAACAAAQPALGTQDTNAYHARLGNGYNYVAGNVFGALGTTTTEALRLENAGPSKVVGNRFDTVRYQAINCAAGNQIIVGNQFGNPSQVGSVEGIHISSGSNVIVGNKFDTTNGAAHWTYCIAEAGGPFSGNIITDNSLIAGTTGVILQNATSTNKIANNPGYNPVGVLGPPAVPASTVNATNNYGVDCIVFVKGGTLTDIKVGGTTTGIAVQAAANMAHTIRVPATQTISITYTVAPTWTWFGE